MGPAQSRSRHPHAQATARHHHRAPAGHLGHRHYLTGLPQINYPADSTHVTAEPPADIMGIMRQNPMTPAGAAPGCPVDESFDPLAPEFLADPYTIMAGLPDGRKPVFFAPSIGYYVVTSYDAIQQVFGDPRTYSAAVAQAPLAPLTPEAQQILLAGGHKPQPSMVSLDEPARQAP